MILKVSAAPYPVTSTSALYSLLQGTYLSSIGFKIDSKKSGWVQQMPPENSKILTLFRPPIKSNEKHSEALLTVRAELLKKSLNLKQYAKTWINDYLQFGFNILGSQFFNQNENLGLVVDLVNYTTQKQIRQVVYLTNQKAIIITCSDNLTEIKNSLPACNSIIRSFTWIQTAKK